MSDIMNRFLNFLRKIKYKLVKMPIPEEDKKIIKKYSISQILEVKHEKKPKVEKKDYFKYILSIISIPLLIVSYYILTYWELSDKVMYTILILSPILFSLSVFLPYFCTKSYSYRRNGIFLSFAIILSISIYLYYSPVKNITDISFIVPVVLLIYLSVMVGTLTYLISIMFIKNISLDISDGIDLNKESFTFMKSKADIKFIDDVLTRIIEYIGEIKNTILIHETRHKIKDSEVISQAVSLGNDFLLLYTYKDNILSFFVLKQLGRLILRDDECKIVQEKIQYIFQNIGGLNPVIDEKEKDELYNSQLDFLRDYKGGSRIESLIKENKKRILASLVAMGVGGVAAYYYRLKEPKGLPTYIGEIAILIVSFILYHFLIEREKK